MSKIKEKDSKRDLLITEALNHCEYIKADSRTIGVFSSYKEMKLANNSLPIKSLIKKHGFRIQMLIK